LWVQVLPGLQSTKATPLNEGGVLAVRNKKEYTLAEKDKSKKPNAIQQYFRETSGELRKVAWPTWPEARQLTSLVLLVMVVMGLLLGLVDALAHAALNALLGL
jgi:preprotein translocase subunit SecE